jgi:tetratricopeptide (TPR) repeat protein
MKKLGITKCGIEMLGMRMKNLGKMAAIAVLGLATTAVFQPILQAQPAPGTASIHGHVTNPAGMAISTGEVRLTTDRSSDTKDRKYPFVFPIDATGNFKGEGIKPDNYLAIVFQDGKSIDFIDNTKLTAGEDATVNFDMTRAEYLAKMTPEDKAALEAFKKKNTETMAANSKISNLNALLTQARADTKAGNYDSAIKAMTDATAAKPDEALLWITMGDAQLGQADAASKAAKAAHTTDASVNDKYAAAATSYQKGLDLNAASKTPKPDLAATADNQLGQAYGKSGKTKEAVVAYEAAAKADPPKAGMYYFNEAATLFNAGDGDDAAAAADKAITADPAKADAYYIKGQALVAKATVDEKTQKITVPPGCVEAYQKYLELVPEGPRAEEVKGILTGIGQPIKSSFKAGKK